MSGERLSADNCVLVVVDIQEKFKPAIHGWDEMLKNTVKLIKGCRILDIPIIHTEQYPRGLGKTVEEVREALDYNPIEKTCFSCAGSDEFMSSLGKTGRTHVILAGIETHVCLFNTAIDLLDAGYTVYFCVDAVSSRKKIDKKIAVKRVHKEGAILTTVEMLLFQLLKDAGHEKFREISGIVK